MAKSPQWYFARNGAQHGPLSADELRKQAAADQLGRDDLVWKPGMPDWIAAGKIKGLFPRTAANEARQTVPAPPPLPPPVPTGASPDSSDAGDERWLKAGCLLVFVVIGIILAVPVVIWLFEVVPNSKVLVTPLILVTIGAINMICGWFSEILSDPPPESK